VASRADKSLAERCYQQRFAPIGIQLLERRQPDMLVRLLDLGFDPMDGVKSNVCVAHLALLAGHKTLTSRLLSHPKVYPTQFTEGMNFITIASFLADCLPVCAKHCRAKTKPHHYSACRSRALVIPTLASTTLTIGTRC